MSWAYSSFLFYQRGTEALGKEMLAVILNCLPEVVTVQGMLEINNKV